VVSIGRSFAVSVANRTGRFLRIRITAEASSIVLMHSSSRGHAQHLEGHPGVALCASAESMRLCLAIVGVGGVGPVQPGPEIGSPMVKPYATRR
jgi:hypothetical protein